MSRRVSGAWGTLAVCLLVGCLPSPDQPEQSLQPGPPAREEFERVEAEIEAMDGIEDAALRLYDDDMTGQYLGGDVDVTPGADPVAVLDDVYATLWSFRSWQPMFIDVFATSEGKEYGLDGPLDKGGYRLFDDELGERYGPWPGPGPTP